MMPEGLPEALWPFFYLAVLLGLVGGAIYFFRRGKRWVAWALVFGVGLWVLPPLLIMIFARPTCGEVC